jgi:hypothetical protein
MVLSNKERQRRYRESLKARAALAPVLTEDGQNFARARIAHYLRERTRVAAVLAMLNRGMRHSSAMGSEPLRDDTEEFGAEMERRITMLYDVISRWARDLEVWRVDFAKAGGGFAVHPESGQPPRLFDIFPTQELTRRWLADNGYRTVDADNDRWVFTGAHED